MGSVAAGGLDGCLMPKGDMNWTRYLLDVPLIDFPAGARVLDLGCGDGTELRELARRGCRPIGLDVRPMRDRRFVCAAGEALPFRDRSFDGVLSKVTLPYTDDRATLTEIMRVLNPRGTCRLVCHGVGYYLRYLLCGQFRERVYAGRTILNTWLYRLTGHRAIADTIYQSPRHFAGAQVSRFLGLPVFIYATIERQA
jgi:ubiquinone/menaquinone biosynthesis C-methylase UbiE